MDYSLRLGSARGIAIRIHPTFVAALLWAVYEWGSAGLAGVLFGVLLLLAVFGCVLLHELSHALVALRYGLTVRGIVLLPIGGVAFVENAAMSPRSETLVALAGPAANLAIAALLSPFIALMIRVHDLSHPLGVLFYIDDLTLEGFIVSLWLANIVMAAFNLLPAFPLDGGRVLRAVLAAVSNRLVATRVATTVGQVLAASLILLGIWLRDLWLPLTGCFVIIMGWLESHSVRVETSLRRLAVGGFAHWESGGIHPDAPVAQALLGGPRDMAVTVNGVVVGMLWRSELLRHLNGNHHNLLVRDIMDRRALVVDAADSVYDVHRWLDTSGLPAVAVVADGRYKGLFSNDHLEHVHAHLLLRGSRALRGLRSLRARLR